MAYKKAKNIVDIFSGAIQVIFYDASRAKYVSYSSGIDISQYVINELRSILGDENVVAK